MLSADAQKPRASPPQFPKTFQFNNCATDSPISYSKCNCYILVSEDRWPLSHSPSLALVHAHIICCWLGPRGKGIHDLCFTLACRTKKRNTNAECRLPYLRPDPYLQESLLSSVEPALTSTTARSQLSKAFGLCFYLRAARGDGGTLGEQGTVGLPQRLCS